MTQPMNPEPESESTDPPSRRTAILVAVAAVLAIIVVIGIVLVATTGTDEPASTASSSSSSVVTQTVTETPSTTDAPATTDETTDETTTTTTDDTDSSTPSNDPGSNPGGLVIYDCGGQAEVRPSSVSSIYCGDNSVSVRDITWSRWGPRTAVGTGTEAINQCRPNCAAGNYEQRRVDVELSSPRRKGFTTITLTGSDGVTQSYQLTGNAPN